MDLKNIEIEVGVMRELASSLVKLQGEPEAQKRALAWLCETFQFAGPKNVAVEKLSLITTNLEKKSDKLSMLGAEMPGIAMITSDNEFALTLRDLKAKSQLDAARRLAHVAIYSYARLFKTSDMPSVEVTGLLKSWRVYDGNSRAMIANSQGLIRTKEGGIALDAHAKQEAESYIEEILNPEIKGTWAPGKRK
jgi:hypothetical protein